MSGLVESVGSVGLHQRSDERVVLTTAQLPTLSEIKNTVRLARQIHATRGQVKYYGEIPARSPHLEAFLRPSSGDASPHGVVFLGHNKRERRADMSDEWAHIRESWREPMTHMPIDRVRMAQERGYSLSTRLGRPDIAHLLPIWEPFGWNEQGIAAFVNEYNTGNAGWFCAARDREGHIRAAAKAEGLRIGGLNIIESTEWGTHPSSRRRGLASAVVTGLNAAIIRTHPPIPYCIFAEGNTALESPGHLVARDAGFDTLSDIESNHPNHVLPQHVSVNNKTRNFLMTQVTPKGISLYYPEEVLSEIIAGFR